MLKGLCRASSNLILKQGCLNFSLKRNAAENQLEHTPVLLAESIEALRINPGETYVDMTFGAGGHSRAMLEEGARVVAIDRDPSVVHHAQQLKAEFKDKFDFEVSKFTDIREVLTAHAVKTGTVSGVLIDSGCSSMQMDQARGFSVSNNSPLDMRMNPAEKDTPTAAALVNVLDAATLAKIFKIYGGEPRAIKIAQAIVEYRYGMKRITTTAELADIVEAAFSEGHQRRDSLGRVTSLATKIFMALRIFVNDELNELNRALFLSQQMLRPGSPAAIITFHSLEDRIVKRHFLGLDLDEPVSKNLSQKFKSSTEWQPQLEKLKTWHPATRKVIVPTIDEVESNPRSRSAKLRVADKL